MVKVKKLTIEKKGYLLYNKCIRWSTHFLWRTRMFLNIWDSIRDFFSNLFQEFNLASLITLVTGIAIGIMICLMMYLSTLVKSVKTVEKKNVFDSKKIRTNQLNISEEEELLLIKKYIKASQDEFKEKQALYNASNKFELAKEISINLANDVA